MTFPLIRRADIMISVTPATRVYDNIASFTKLSGNGAPAHAHHGRHSSGILVSPPSRARRCPLLIASIIHDFASVSF